MAPRWVRRNRRALKRVQRKGAYHGSKFMKWALFPRASGNTKAINFCQSFVSNITSTAMTDLNIAHKVKFSDLPSYTYFQTLFQQYKINGAIVKFVPTHNCYDPNNGTAFMNVPIYTAIDRDQDTTPTVAQILAFGNVRVHKFQDGFTEIVPLTTTITGSSTYEIKKPSKSVWLDTSNPDQYHNGLDIAIPAAGWGASNMSVGYVITKLFFSVRYMDG